ncbi:MAG: hypothetical protein AMS25_13840 [Gemmatimonas sp. SM23_52]|nr:MAG: hypothetical protein AMS25_13840 [Gemmatimonas sp. SM23_52]
MLIRSFLALQSENPGFEADGRLALSTHLPDSRYPTDEGARAYGDANLERLAAVPGVESVAITSLIPVSGQDEIWGLEIEGRPPSSLDEYIAVLHYRVSAGYFQTMGIPLRMGREFTPGDRAGSVPVTVVSESFAHDQFPGESPLGKRIRFAGDDPFPFWEIVGVAADVQHYQVGQTSMSQVYLAFAQRPHRRVNFIIKASVLPLSLVPAVRTEIQTLDPDMPVEGVRTLEQIIAEDISTPRFGGSTILGDGDENGAGRAAEQHSEARASGWCPPGGGRCDRRARRRTGAHPGVGIDAVRGGNPRSRSLRRSAVASHCRGSSSGPNANFR